MISLGDDLIQGLKDGVALDRPEEILRLAEEVLAMPPGFPEGWAEKLAKELSQFGD